MNQHNIKFRGKRTDNGEWIEGFPIIGILGAFILPFDCAFPSENMNTDLVEVVRETVGQYIGKLSNGDEVFINDLIKHGGTIRIVEYRLGNTMLRRQNGRDTILLSFSEKPVKLGNIFDNPELLENGN